MEHTRTHLNESNTAAMVRVHICVNLKYKACELFFCRHHFTLHGLHWAWRWGDADKAIEQLLYTESVQSRTKEYWSNECIKIVLFLKFGINAINQFNIATQLLCIVGTHSFINHRVVDVGNVNTVRHALLISSEKAQIVLIDIVNTLKVGTAIDWPTQRANRNLQFAFQFI